MLGAAGNGELDDEEGERGTCVFKGLAVDVHHGSGKCTLFPHVVPLYAPAFPPVVS